MCRIIYYYTKVKIYKFYFSKINMVIEHGLRVNPEFINTEGRILIKPKIQGKGYIKVGKTNSNDVNDLLGAVTDVINQDSVGNVALAVDEDGNKYLAKYMMIKSNDPKQIEPSKILSCQNPDIFNIKPINNNDFWHQFIYTPFGFEQESSLSKRTVSNAEISEGRKIRYLDEILEDLESLESRVRFRGLFNPYHSRIIFPLGDEGLDVTAANYALNKQIVANPYDKPEAFELFVNS